jgi:hypothetical protein
MTPDELRPESRAIAPGDAAPDNFAMTADLTGLDSRAICAGDPGLDSREITPGDTGAESRAILSTPKSRGRPLAPPIGPNASKVSVAVRPEPNGARTATEAAVKVIDSCANPRLASARAAAAAFSGLS